MDVTNLVSSRLEQPDDNDRMHLLFATPALAPYTAGDTHNRLAEICAGLAGAVARQGHRVSVFTPLYPSVDPEDHQLSRRLRSLTVPRQGKSQQKADATIWEGRTHYGVRTFLLDQPRYFGKDDPTAGDNTDVADRFAFFGRAIIEFCRTFSLPVDLLHLHDWYGALAPIYRDHYYEDELGDIGTVLSVHDLDEQGEFPGDSFALTGLPQSYNKKSELLHDDNVNYLKGGIRHADVLTTASPTYAEQIQKPEHGEGLHKIFQERSDDLTGITYGVDYGTWSPDVDTHIAVNYDVDNLNGKRRNKAELQHHFDLAIRPAVPLLGSVGPFDDRHGLNLMLPALEKWLHSQSKGRPSFQVLLCGTGEDAYEHRIRQLAKDYPEQVGAYIGDSLPMRHHMFAGCDAMLIPHAKEPCGLTQLCAMRYGTLPIAHSTGGLADTVIDVGDTTGAATGFLFDRYDTDAMLDRLKDAVDRYGNYRKWRPVMEQAMRQDHSWAATANKYLNVYAAALGLDADTAADQTPDNDDPDDAEAAE
jgi:starch synthase